MPVYSIIVPVYKTEKYLAECLDSILAQNTKSEYEVILVDDGSPDSSGSICDDYAAGHENIRVIHQENQGVSTARNVGIEAAAGEYLLFLDSDDLWDKRLLSTMDEFLPEKPDMIYFGHSLFNNARDHIVPCISASVPSGESGPEYLQKLVTENGNIPTTVCSFTVRRELLNDHHIRFDSSLVCSEDFDVNMYCLQAAKKIVGTKASLYWYRVNGGSKRPYRPEVLMCDLKTKAKWFYEIPSPALADLFVSNCSFISKFGTRKEAKELVDFAEKNRDIWSHASHRRMKQIVLLFRLFGVYHGSAIYMKLIQIKHMFVPY